MAKLSHLERSLASKLGRERRAHAETRKDREGYQARVWSARKEVARVHARTYTAPVGSIDGVGLLIRVNTAATLGYQSELVEKDGTLQLHFVKREDA